MKKLIAVIVVLTLLLVISFQPKMAKTPSYTIVFYSNGGTAIRTIEVESNQKAYEPLAPVRASSEFEGWYTSNDFSEESKFSFDTRINKSVTLYAKWKVESYNVFYDLGQGAWPSEEVQGLYVTSFGFESNIVYFKFKNSQSPRHPDGATNPFTGWRTIPVSEYNELSAEEKKNYPYIEKIEPKKDNLDEIFDEEKNLTLYAYYRKDAN